MSPTIGHLPTEVIQAPGCQQHLPSHRDVSCVQTEDVAAAVDLTLGQRLHLGDGQSSVPHVELSNVPVQHL